MIDTNQFLQHEDHHKMIHAKSLDGIGSRTNPDSEDTKKELKRNRTHPNNKKTEENIPF